MEVTSLLNVKKEKTLKRLISLNGWSKSKTENLNDFGMGYQYITITKLLDTHICLQSAYIQLRHTVACEWAQN